MASTKTGWGGWLEWRLGKLKICTNAGINEPIPLLKSSHLHSILSLLMCLDQFSCEWVVFTPCTILIDFTNVLTVLVKLILSHSIFYRTKYKLLFVFLLSRLLLSSIYFLMM